MRLTGEDAATPLRVCDGCIGNAKCCWRQWAIYTGLTIGELTHATSYSPGCIDFEAAVTSTGHKGICGGRKDEARDNFLHIERDKFYMKNECDEVIVTGCQL